MDRLFTVLYFSLCFRGQSSRPVHRPVLSPLHRPSPVLWAAILVSQGKRNLGRVQRAHILSAEDITWREGGVPHWHPSPNGHFADGPSNNSVIDCNNQWKLGKIGNCKQSSSSLTGFFGQLFDTRLSLIRVLEGGWVREKKVLRVCLWVCSHPSLFFRVSATEIFALRCEATSPLHSKFLKKCHATLACHASVMKLVPVPLDFDCGLTFGAILNFRVEKWTKKPIMPSIPWKPFGLNNVLPRRFPRPRRGNKRQPIVPLKEWKIVRGDTVRHASFTPCGNSVEIRQVVDPCT